MPSQDNTNLIAEIDKFCTAQNPPISRTEFGRLVCNDTGLLTTLVRGRDIRMSTYLRIRGILDGTTPLPQPEVSNGK